MQRDQSLQQLKNTLKWDIIIIGGGATGLGCALDAASRGLKTLLPDVTLLQIPHTTMHQFGASAAGAFCKIIFFQ